MSSISNYRGQLDGKLPVFVSPSCLNFYFDDQRTYKQVVTIYNPYDFTVQFKVLSTNPTKYKVVDSEGIIKNECCIDIVIRITEFLPNTQREDKFRIHLYKQDSLPKPVGRKEISAFLSPTNHEQENKPYTRKSRRSNPKDVDDIFLRQRRESVVIQRSLPSIPVILLTICCIVALMLPTDKDKTESFVPSYLHLSMNQKLVAAYVLGLVTMAVLKT